MTITLRSYQTRAIDTFLETRRKSVLLVAPTGAGKGTMAAALMGRYARQKKRVLFLVHRRELVHDMIERLRRIGVPVAQTLYSDRFVRVVSVQAALRMRIAPVDLLVVDEAHHYAADEWQRVVDGCRAKRIVGFTATPERGDGRPLGDMFEQIVEVVSYSELMRRGYIVPCRVLRPQRKMDSDEIAHDPADAYLRYGHRERAIVFVRRIAEAADVAARLSQAGVPTGVITGRTRKDVRDDTMARLERGDLDVVVNVGVLTEGIDVPHVTCIVLARPCAHASTYLQIVGRALRAAEGKRIATLIDLVGASYRHGLPSDDRSYRLDGDHGIDVARRGGPSGPSGDRSDEVENLALDLVEVCPEGFERRLPPPAPPEPKAEPEPPRRVPWRERIAAMTPAERKAKFAPKRPHGGGPMEQTEGSICRDRGIFFLMWRERGKRRRLGLATQDEAEALALLAYFRERGAAALRERVRLNKRTQCCLDRARRPDGQTHRAICLRTWNEDKTKEIVINLGTRDEAEALTLLELYRSGDRAAFNREVTRNRARAEREAAEKRSESTRRAWAERQSNMST